MIYIRSGNSYSGTGRIVLAFTDEATGLPIDLTGADVWFAIKRRRSDIDADALVLKSTEDDVALDGDPETGLAYVTLTEDETAELPEGCWHWAAQAKDGTDRIIEGPRSRVTVVADLIQDTEVA